MRLDGVLRRAAWRWRYWQEKALKNPPPPGAVWPLVARIMIVPCATLLPEVAEHVLPPAEAVAHEMIVLPGVQVADAVEGVTEIKVQVVLTPVYE
jgi:hypothetical protein